MRRHMPDSHLKGAERALQHPFRKAHIFNGLLVAAAVIGAYLPMRAMPDRRPLPPVTVALNYRPVALPPVAGPLTLAGAWELDAGDPRLGGLSALTIDRDRFLAVTDRGAVVRFDFPTEIIPKVQLRDLREGPGPYGKKWARDAESLAYDPGGRGWWVGYEQNHSLWLYDDGFGQALETIDLHRSDWWNNRGAEGLVAEDSHLMVTAENGRDAIRVGAGSIERLTMEAGADVAEAALAPDGSSWLLLRSRGVQGITQSIAPLLRTRTGYRAGSAWPVPKGGFDNYEGMAITSLPDGSWRFWLVTDDGHRFMARTLLVALDLTLPVRPRHDKSPAQGTGLSNKPPVGRP